MSTLPKTFKLKKTKNKLFNRLLETYFIYDMWRPVMVVPGWVIENSNEPPTGWSEVKVSKYCKSETEKAEQCLAFMRHLSELYYEDVICFEFPRNYPVLNPNNRMHFCTIGSLTTYAITGQKPTICIVYDMDSFREKDNVERAFLLNSHRPTVVYYLD